MALPREKSFSGVTNDHSANRSQPACGVTPGKILCRGNASLRAMHGADELKQQQD
jgi:hypothetical protein